MIYSNQRKWGSEWYGQRCPRALGIGSGICIPIQIQVGNGVKEEYSTEHYCHFFTSCMQHNLGRNISVSLCLWGLDEPKVLGVVSGCITWYKAVGLEDIHQTSVASKVSPHILQRTESQLLFLTFMVQEVSVLCFSSWCCVYIFCLLYLIPLFLVRLCLFPYPRALLLLNIGSLKIPLFASLSLA